MRALAIRLAGLFVLLGLAGTAAHAADQAFSVHTPVAAKSQRLEAFKLVPLAGAALRIDLGRPDPAEIEAIRKANSLQFEKVLTIGVGRRLDGVPAAFGEALAWEAVAGGRAAHWEVVSEGAEALRVGLLVGGLPEGAELRFAGAGAPEVVYGPFLAKEVLAPDVYWSPVLEGEHATIELFVPDGGATRELEIAIEWVSHIFASPSAPTIQFMERAKASQFCEVDLICRSAGDSALATTGKAVARMSFTVSGGGTGLCTGTLLATTQGAGAPYFYSANHCISTQQVASTLTTHWFYDRTSCGSGGVNPSYTQLTGGSALLYANATTDALLLRLNATPPGGVIYAGWNAATLANGTALTAIHHPAGDLKKVSLGSMGGFSAYGGGAGSTHIIALWNGIATGVTEGGSSGSGIFSAVGSPATDYQLRGGLHGGPSSCSATGTALRDYYSRFDNAYPSMSSYLNPSVSCSYALTTGSASIGAAGGSSSFGVTTTASCAWTAVTNAAWITTSSSGSGSGTVSYTVAANPGAARSGTLTVAGQTFTVNQLAAAPTSLIVNGGFESGATGWVQTSSGGYAIITNEPGLARTGSFDAWLGGYASGTDTLTQDVTIPANASTAILRFWYRIATNETSGVAYDFLSVTVASPGSGAILANLVSYSNLNAVSTWTQSAPFDLAAFRGQTVRIVFSAVNNGSAVTNFRIDDVTLEATLSSNPPRLGNISTRMQVLTGNDVMIGGFVVGGSTSKTVVVRARGPSLVPFGITNAIVDPMLQLVRSSDQATIAFNDDWSTSANFSSIQASGFAPSHGLESAIMATLGPGAYTAIVSGYQSVTGVGIIEVFEVDAPAAPLANISTRGQVLTGNDVMIGGFVISGDGPQTVIVRARGPSLVPFGITNAIVDPMLQLVRSSDQSTIAFNDDWQTAANAAQISSSGFAPSAPLESAILVTLQPGAYTAIVSGYQGATGVGIVEVFAQ